MKSSNTTSSCEIPLTMTNNLWYYKQPSSVSSNSIHIACHAVIKLLNQTATHELWHHRMGNSGKTAMEKLPCMVDIIPKLFPRTPLYQSPHCLIGKAYKHMAGYTPSLHDITKTCSMIQMDFGFVRGSNYAHRDKNDHLVTNIDGYNSYLLIMDAATRHHWIFLTKSKDPPTDILITFLATHVISEDVRRCTDQGEN